MLTSSSSSTRLAGARGRPVLFQLERIRFDEARRPPQAFAERSQKEEEAVSLGLIVPERAVRGRVATAGDGARDQRERRVGVPGLSGGGDGSDESQRDEQQHAHRLVISRGARIAASTLLLLAGCSHDSTGTPQGVPLASLLVLPRQDSIFVPSSPVTLLVRNNVLNSFTINETDAASTVFATLTLAPHSIVT